ncbi:MAG: type II secretion system protein GspK [Chthoniobacteraceae bacterium]|nr:type II secretion system protein GspK [Chthoniobacteraceae bacterium]
MKRKALILSRAAHTAKNGSALLAVFWGIIVLTMAVAGWFFWLQQRVQEHGQDSRSIEALAMAHSGIAMALNPKVDRYSSLLQTEIEPGLGFRVTMESEGSRLNLKVLLEGMLQKNGSCDSIFRKWLEWVIGVEDLIQRDRLVDCLLDYVDTKNTVRLHGEKESKDYHPAHRMILSLDELKRIPGMEPLLAYPGWKDLLTLDSSKILDLMEAPEELLRVLPGFSEVQVQRLLQIRVGMDGILHTEDDRKFESTDALLKQLGMVNKTSRDELAALVGVNEPTIRIKAEGYSGKVIRQVQVVVRKGTGQPLIFSWIE